MTLASSIAGDYAYFDGIETVLHTARDTGTVTTSIPALKSSPQRGSVFSSDPVAIDPDTTMFSLWSTTLTVSPGDRITQSDGTFWIVENAAHSTMATRWRCMCRKGVS